MRTGAAGVLVGFGGGAAHTTRTHARHPRADGLGGRRRRRGPARLPRRVRRPLRARHRRRRHRPLAATSSRPSPAAPTRSCSARRSPGPTDAPGRGCHWGSEAHHAELPRGERVEVGTLGSLEEILLGPGRARRRHDQPRSARCAGRWPRPATPTSRSSSGSRSSSRRTSAADPACLRPEPTAGSPSDTRGSGWVVRRAGRHTLPCMAPRRSPTPRPTPPRRTPWTRGWSAGSPSGWSARPRPATLLTHTPMTGAPLAALPLSTPDDVRVAYAGARAAQRSWARLPVEHRRRVVLRFHDLVLERQRQLLDLIQLESGKARVHAFEEVADTAMVSAALRPSGRRLPAAASAAGGVPGADPARSSCATPRASSASSARGTTRCRCRSPTRSPRCWPATPSSCAPTASRR